MDEEAKMIIVMINSKPLLSWLMCRGNHLHWRRRNSCRFRLFLKSL